MVCVYCFASYSPFAYLISLNQPKTITSYEAFEAAIEKAAIDGKVMVVKVGATWCKPCKAITPCWNKQEQKYADMMFVEIDYDLDEELMDDYKIKKLPTFIVIKDGKEEERLLPVAAGEQEGALEEFVSKQFKGAVANSFTFDADF